MTVTPFDQWLRTKVADGNYIALLGIACNPDVSKFALHILVYFSYSPTVIKQASQAINDYALEKGL
jgi:hypothetical protein